MKIALAQLNSHVGDFGLNTEKIISSINKAKSSGADLVVFAELSVCGYPPLDFLEFSHFIEECKKAVEKIAVHCQGIAAIVGAPSVNPVPDGKNLFNSAWFLNEGKIQTLVHKSLLPTYDVFDEYRYFEPGKNTELIGYKGSRFALTVCEDLWNIYDDPLYTVCPMDELVKENPDFIINIAASPFNYRHEEERKKILQKNAIKYNLPVYYVNQVGAQTELVFDGGSMIIDKSGGLVAQLRFFEEDFAIFDTAAPETMRQKLSTDVEKIHAALLLGLKDYFRKMEYSSAILGLSGGIDSAVVLALAAEALGNDKVLSVLMPSAFSSNHSVSDSLEMCKNLQSPYRVFKLNPLYEQFLETLDEAFKGLDFNTTEENLQARIRATLLMAMSNKFGYILLNTSNKSELAVGYGTLYGDMCGGLSVIGDLYKTQVYELAEFINRNKEIIPQHIMTKHPSAELRVGQKDSDSLPAYHVLDKILNLYIEKFKSPEDIIATGFERTLVLRILKMVNSNEYKRKQFAPVLRVSPKAFGMGRRMPIVGKYLS